MKAHRLSGSIGYHAGVVAFGFVMIYPILWMLCSSVKPNDEIFANASSLFTARPTIENYLIGWQGFGGISFAAFFKNSLWLTSLSTFLSVVSSTVVAYGFARIRFRLRNFWFSVMMVTMMLPSQVLLLPQFILFFKLSLTGTSLPLILPHLGGRVFFIFLIMQFIDGIPRELDEAATIDGCGRYQIFFKVICPLIVPAIVTSLVFSFMWVWEDFFTPLIYLDTPSKYTIPLALRMFNDSTSAANWGATLAMSSLSLMPVFLLFLFFQKYLVEGIATTGLKG